MTAFIVLPLADPLTVAFLPVPPNSWASNSKVLSLLIDPSSLAMCFPRSHATKPVNVLTLRAQTF